MTECCRAEREDGGADLCIGYHLDAEDVGEAGPAVVAKGAEDEILAFLVEDEDAGEHSRISSVSGGQNRTATGIPIDRGIKLR